MIEARIANSLVLGGLETRMPAEREISAGTCESVSLLAHDQHRHLRERHHFSGNATQEESLQFTTSVAANDDEVDFFLCHVVGNRLASTTRQGDIAAPARRSPDEDCGSCG